MTREMRLYILFCPSMKTMLISTDIIECHTILKIRNLKIILELKIQTSPRADCAWKKTASFVRHFGPSRKAIIDQINFSI